VAGVGIPFGYDAQGVRVLVEDGTPPRHDARGEDVLVEVGIPSRYAGVQPVLVVEETSLGRCVLDQASLVRRCLLLCATRGLR